VVRVMLEMKASGTILYCYVVSDFSDLPTNLRCWNFSLARISAWACSVHGLYFVLDVSDFYSKPSFQAENIFRSCKGLDIPRQM